MTFRNDTRRSPPDSRDWVAENIFPRPRDLSFPSTLDLRKFLPPVRSQGGRGTCASFAGSAVKEYQERLDIDYTKHLSPEFIYFYREGKPNAGMYGRDVFKILQEKGIATEDDFPYDNKDAENVPSDVAEKAVNLKIKSYAQVYTIDGLKSALYLNGVCWIAFPTYDGGEIFYKPKNNGDPVTGGHALAVVGYNKEGFIIRNSWGNWNGDGYFIFPYREFGLHWEIFCSIDDSSTKIPPIPWYKKFSKILEVCTGK